MALGMIGSKYPFCSVFFADDGLLLTKSVCEMRNLIEIIEVTGRKIGLEINRSKSASMIFNMNNKPRAISGISIVSEMKYLGLTINDTRNCFKKNKESKLKNLERMANLTYSVKMKSCNRIMMGNSVILIGIMQ